MSGETIGLFAIAFVLGTISAIMPIGPVTVLVIRRALGGDYRGALKLGLGRVGAEPAYCAMAVFGVSALFERYPAVRLGIELLGTVVLVTLGVWLLTQKPKVASLTAEDDPDPDPKTRALAARRRRWGNWSGFIISALNPTFILSWSAGIAIALTVLDLEPTLLDKVGFPVCLALGLSCGYLILVSGLRKWGERISDSVLRWLLRGLGAMFVIMALVNVARILGWLG